MLSGSNLSDELVIEILRRLPTKVICRFKLVSRSWQSLFRNPDFIVLHKDTQNGSCIFTRRKLYKEVKLNNPVSLTTKRKKVNPFCLLYCDDVHHHRLVDLDLPFLDGGEANMKHVDVFAYCDGIAWLQSRHNGTAYLWNHSTGEFKVMPTTHLYLTTPELATYTIWFGLSFDPLRNHVKVVRVTVSQPYSPETKSYSPLSFLYKVEGWSSSSTVVDPSSDSNWRQIDAAPSFPPGWLYSGVDGVCLGGKCYWGSVEEGVAKPIASFDMADETFEMIPQPEYPPITELCWKMTEMRRSLAIMAMDGAEWTSTKRTVHVWVLMNGTHCDDGQSGGALSSCFWSKYLAVELSSIPDIPATPLGFCRDAILIQHDFDFSLHDIATGETTRVDVELLCDRVATPAYACHESLISFKAGN